MRTLVDFARENNATVFNISESSMHDLIHRDDFNAVLYALEGLDLIAVRRNDLNAPYIVQVTQSGMSYFENRSDKIKNFIMSSIIVPILVAIITAFITVYILPSLGIRAQLWLSDTSLSQLQSQVDLLPICDPTYTPELRPADQE